MQQPTVGVLGTGAIGSYYGVRLAQAGYQVSFLARSEYQQIQQHGLRIDSAVHGSLQLEQVDVYRDVARMPQVDWLLVATKTTSNAGLAPLINQLLKPSGKLVLLQNGLAVEDELRPQLREDIHLLGGLCFICVHRSAPGVIEHQAYGGINLGYHSGPDTGVSGDDIAAQGAQMFAKAGEDSQAIDLLKARWQKLVWNVPYNGLSVLLDTTTGAMMGNPSSRALIEAIMHEVTEAAAACGQQLPENIVPAMLKNTDRMPDYHPSMYHDYAHQRELELQAIYRAPLAAAKTAGCSMPRVEMLLQALEFKTR